MSKAPLPARYATIPGRLAASDGGTILLDEIGDLPLALQPKLLRFVQDREYERVGDHKTRRADVRVLAATNVNLEDAMKAGRFREDLLYRIKVIEITLPPFAIGPTMSFGSRTGCSSSSANATASTSAGFLIRRNRR